MRRAHVALFATLALGGGLAGADPAKWIGLDNYREFFTKAESWQVVTITLIFTVSAVVFSMVLGLALAMLLDQNLKGRNLVRSAVFAPFVISGAAIGAVTILKSSAPPSLVRMTRSSP